MDTVIVIIGIGALALLVNVLLKKSYNFIFLVGRKPILWAMSVAVIGIAVWTISAAAGWSVTVPAWASAIALVMNLPPSQGDSEEKQAIQSSVDEIYAEMGVPNGRTLYRAGLAMFFVACIGSWVVLYGEVCTSGDCQSIINSIF